MSDQEKKEESANIPPQPDAENKKQSGELSEEELKKATGGAGEKWIEITSTSHPG
jgi:hypothetical protein